MKTTEDDLLELLLTILLFIAIGLCVYSFTKCSQSKEKAEIKVYQHNNI